MKGDVSGVRDQRRVQRRRRRTVGERLGHCSRGENQPVPGESMPQKITRPFEPTVDRVGGDFDFGA